MVNDTYQPNQTSSNNAITWFGTAFLSLHCKRSKDYVVHENRSIERAGIKMQKHFVGCMLLIVGEIT